MYNKMRMREAQFHHRTHDKFTKGLWNTENVIKSCMVAFILLWVSYNIMFGIASY
jgi:hypothetical protein